MDSDLGAKVKKLRISQGLTQEDVAKALDVTPGYISNVENGRNLMTLRMLSYYAELTGVSLDYLAGSVDNYKLLIGCYILIRRIMIKCNYFLLALYLAVESRIFLRILRWVGVTSRSSSVSI